MRAQTTVTVRDGRRTLTRRGLCVCDGVRMLRELGPGLWQLIVVHLPDCRRNEECVTAPGTFQPTLPGTFQPTLWPDEGAS